MTVYLTKVWGFDDPSGPLAFGAQGWRDRARDLLADGDLVVLVGTKGGETEPLERGRVLGLVEPTKQPVLSQDFDLPTREIDFTAEGEYRWPYGLLNRRAWRFLEPRPLLEDVSSRQFSMDAAAGIVPLLADETDTIMALPKRPVELLMPVRARARVEGLDAARRRGAPSPTTHRTGIMHMRRAPAFTYCMAAESAFQVSFKVGWAFDCASRQRQFNLYAMPSLGGIRYITRLHRLWGQAKEAFEMEQ